VLRVKHWDDHQ